jgi:hypothetical protein
LDGIAVVVDFDGIAPSLEQNQSPCVLFDLKQKKAFFKEKGFKTAEK